MLLSQEREDPKVYFTGVVSLFLSVALILFAIYILPFLIWGFYYDVPDFISHYLAFAEESLELSPSTSKFVVWISFIIPGFIAGYISYYISNLLDERRRIMSEQLEDENKEDLDGA